MVSKVTRTLTVLLILMVLTSLSFGRADLSAAKPARGYSKFDYSYRAGDIASLSRGFSQPPIEAGPWVYWFCFDNAITADEMEREIKEMVAAGISGAELRFVEFAWWRQKDEVDKELAMVGHKRLEFLSDEFIDVLEHACSVAQRYGFKISMNMGMGWPPGGTWITDKYRTKKLVSSVTIVDGPKEVGRDVKVPVPIDGKVFAWQLKDEVKKTVAAESFVDLTTCVRVASKEGSLFWKVPKGKWLIGTFSLGFGGGLDKAYGNPVDPGSKEAVKFHLDYIFDKLEPKLGKYFGTTLTEMASDSWEYDGSPYWTAGMDEAFSKLHGYELPPKMYAMVGYGDDREHIMADIETTQQKLVNENFFMYTKQVLNSYGLGHRPQAYGRGMSRNLFEVYTNCDVPEIEEGVRLPEAVWITHTLGKPITSVEALTFLSRNGNNVISPVVGGEQKAFPLDEPGGAWETNPAMLRWFSNAHYARGINRMQMHSFGYSPEGVPMPGWRMYAEIHLNRNVSWWKYMNQYGMWARRVQWILQAGEPVADTLVYPVEGTVSGEHKMAWTGEQPISPMNCVDATNTYTFPKIWQSDKGRYEVKNLCLLGDIETIEEARKVSEILTKGAKVTYCGVEPEKWSAFRLRSREAGDMLKKFKLAMKHDDMVDARQQGWQKVIENNRSVRWYPEEAVLTYLHRRVDGAEVYFLMNCGDEFDGEVEFRHADMSPQIWDPDKGTIEDCAQWTIADNKVRVKMQIGHLESAIIVFVKLAQPLHAVSCQGGRIERQGGKLYAIVDGQNICKVQLSDGRARKIIAKNSHQISLDQRWRLSASSNDGLGVKGDIEVKLDKLISWRQLNEMSRFSGIASYEKAFDVGSEMVSNDLCVELDLGRVYEVAEVWVNGEKVAVSWYPPYKVDITGHLKQGKNQLRIDVANVLKNYLTEGQYSRPSGLLGPVKIRAFSKILLDD